jgi:hypothetical protein
MAVRRAGGDLGEKIAMNVEAVIPGDLWIASEPVA